jgi:hypothetical protein
MKTGAVLAATVGCAIALCGCGSPDPVPPACVTLRTSCGALYLPASYANVFTKTFQTSCAVAQGTCHTADARMGGLYFVDPDQTYDLLTGKIDGRARVRTDQPGCGILAQRLKATDPAIRMPKGSGLSDAELCDLELWLVAGAPKTP